MRMVRDRYPWRTRTQDLTLGTRTLIMGVLDVSAASGETGGAPKVNALLERARAIQDSGADLIDVSTQPTRSPPKLMAANEQLRQLVPLLRKFRHNLDVPISVQTCNAETAKRALELGAEVINDWSGLCYDPRLASVVKQHDAGLVLGHVRGTPDTWGDLPPLSNLMSVIARDLRSSMDRASAAGIDRRRIVIDPGLDQGKRGLENYRILADLDRLSELNRPILVSLSGKPFLTASVRSSEEERLFATAAVAALAICAGAHIVRVSEIEQVRHVARTTDRVFEAFERS